MTRSRPGPVCLAVLSLVLTGACENVVRSSAVVVRDSAGVTIIESPAPAWRRGEAWTIPPEPLVEVSTDGAGQPLAWVRGVLRLDDGTIVIANGGDGTLRFHDAAGRLVRAIGNKDDSNAGLPAIDVLVRAGDSLVVPQRFRQPTRVFDLRGTHLRSTMPDSLDAFPFVTQFWQLTDGSYVLLSSPQGLLPRGETWQENATFLRARPAATPQRILSLPGVRFARVPSGVERVLLSPVLQFVVHDGRIIAGYPDRYDIGVYDADGTALQRVRRAWRPEPVTGVQAERVRAVLHERIEASYADMPEPLQDDRHRMTAEAFPIADHHPAHGRLLVDAAGHLWIERADPDWLPHTTDRLPVAAQPLAWDVFDPAGLWLGSVDVPARFYVTAIGEDWVAGVAYEADGAERARVYRLVKPGAAGEGRS